MSTYRPSADSYGIANNCDPATVDYFIKIFGAEEAIELSNIDNPTKNSIDAEKIQLALNDAAVLINNYISTAPYQGKLLIAGSYRRTQATLARCYLDTLRPRQAVLDACERALEQMELWSARAQPTAAIRFQEARAYWGEGGCFLRADYARGRSFTETSMLPWQALHGANNRLNNIPPNEARQYVRDIAGTSGSCGGTPQGEEIDTSLQDMNDLVSALEKTRQLGNFENTQPIGNNPTEDNSLAVGIEEEEFDSTNLIAGEEY